MPRFYKRLCPIKKNKKNRMKQKTKKQATAAFVLAEVLVALSIVAILIPSTVAMLNLLQHSFKIHQDIQDEVSLNQLRRTLLLAEDVTCLNDLPIMKRNVILFYAIKSSS